jgi:hypothetical protein
VKTVSITVCDHDVNTPEKRINMERIVFVIPYIDPENSLQKFSFSDFIAQI